jgi:hypothetical protein
MFQTMLSANLPPTTSFIHRSAFIAHRFAFLAFGAKKVFNNGFA